MVSPQLSLLNIHSTNTMYVWRVREVRVLGRRWQRVFKIMPHQKHGAYYHDN